MGILVIIILGAWFLYRKIMSYNNYNGYNSYSRPTKRYRRGLTDEELLTYSVLSGNKRAEKFFLWRIWTRR